MLYVRKSISIVVHGAVGSCCLCRIKQCAGSAVLFVASCPVYNAVGRLGLEQGLDFLLVLTYNTNGSVDITAVYF